MSKSVIVPAPTSDIRESKLVLKVGVKKLLATFHETVDSTSVYIGGTTHYCVHMNITKPESSIVNPDEPYAADMVNLHYNQDCDLEKQFQRSTDTHMILLLMMSVIKDRFPYVTRVRFTDTSYRVCNNGIAAELSEVYYITSGRTWYETHFGAYLEGGDLAKFKTADAKFQEIKKKITWGALRRIMRVEDDTWQPLYESVATWQEFFEPIRNQLGAAEFCDFVAPWLHMFLFKLMRFHFAGVTYNIDIAGPLTIAYTTEPYHKGAGRRQTRCRPRRLRPVDEV
jgi:hypothetical protein